MRSVRSLVRVLERQVERYPAGRDLYDDTGTVDPRERLELALLELEEFGVALDESLPLPEPVPLPRSATSATTTPTTTQDAAEPAEDGAR